MKTPSFLATGLVVVALAACGSPDAQAPAAADSASSLDPIDAVPLPLDENPMSPIAVVAPVEKSADKVATTEKPSEDVAVKSDAAPETVTEPDVTTVARPPRIVVAPRAPVVAPPARPSAPTQPPAQTEPEKPVLIF